MRVLDRVTVYKALDHYCNQAIVARLTSGDLVCVFNEERERRHADNGSTSLVRSTDGGRTWDPESRVVVLPATDQTGNWDCAVAQLADGTLLVTLCQAAYFRRGIDWEGPQYDASQFGLLRGWIGTFALRSGDQGRSWSSPIPVNTMPMKFGSTRVAVTQLPDGGILLPLYGRLDEWGYGLREMGGEAMRAYFVRSDDNGLNWEYFSTIAYDPARIAGYAEPAPLVRPDGRVVVMLRVHHRPTQRPDNIYMAVSDDGGYTFAPPRRLKDLWGYPAQLINLQDGRALMTYGYRRGEFGVKACVSEDGLAWDGAAQLTLHEGGTGPRSDPTWWHTGYPCTTQLDDGTLVTVYHLFSRDDPPVQYVEAVRWRLD
jgi:sialidase-1